MFVIAVVSYMVGLAGSFGFVRFESPIVVGDVRACLISPHGIVGSGFCVLVIVVSVVPEIWCIANCYMC